MVLVEKWLNDDEYKVAEENGDIFSPEQDDSSYVQVCFNIFRSIGLYDSNGPIDDQLSHRIR